jgi:hypothetical protein
VIPTLPEKPNQQDGPERMTSVDSQAYFEADDVHDDYDDFSSATGGGGGGGGCGGKHTKRQEQRGGSGGSGTVYSSKHVRQNKRLESQSSKKAKSVYGS